MSAQPRLLRYAACSCGSERTLAACCLPWEEAFQRLVGRLLTFANTPSIRQLEPAAASVFWNIEGNVRPGKGLGAEGGLRFLEWFLHDHSTSRGKGPLLGEFADTAAGLSTREESLLFDLLLAPFRPFEVIETVGARGILVKDLLTGTERAVGPFSFAIPPIRSDVLICRLVPTGRLIRPGAGLLVLPAASREELLAYVRTAYRVTRPARHVSLEDFLDGATHLYHHYFFLRGRNQGGRAEETLRRERFAPGRVRYQGKEVAQIRASLGRHLELERQVESGDEVRYAWIDLKRAVTRATVMVRRDEIQVSADTREDLTEAARFLETCLRGLVEFAGEEALEGSDAGGDAAARRESAAPGTAFLRNVLDRWADLPSPLLDDRTPRDAAKSRMGRQQVAAVLLGLERELARLRRLGRAWADVSALREQLNLPPAASPGPRRKRA